MCEQQIEADCLEIAFQKCNLVMLLFKSADLCLINSSAWKNVSKQNICTMIYFLASGGGIKVMYIVYSFC